MKREDLGQGKLQRMNPERELGRREEGVGVRNIKAKTGQQELTGIDRDRLLYSIGN